MPPSSGPRGVKPVKVKVKKAQSFTAPIGQNTIPGQAQAKAKVQRATRKVERNVVAPAIPKLKHPTSAQRGAAQSLVAGSLHKQGITTTDQVKALPKAQRVRVNRAKGYATTNAKRANAAGALVRGVSGPYSQAELAKLGRLADAQTRAQVLPGPKPSKLSIGPATINLTNAERVIGAKLANNPAAAFLHGTTALGHFAGKHGGIPGRALQDAIDMPANTVTSAFLVGRALSQRRVGEAAKMMGQPILHTIEHPVKSFEQHPLNTVLILRGVKGAIGHGAGKIMRTGALGDTAKRAASTEREAKTIPGVQRATRRQYSRDPSSKAVQVAVEKAQARRATRKGESPPTRMSAQDVRQGVAEDVAQAKLRSQRNVAETGTKAKQALGYKRGRGPTAATNLHAQGIVNATEADLRAYLEEIRKREPKLATEELRARSRETQKLIEQALKKHDPEKVAGAARAYQEFVATELEPKAQAAGLVEPHIAEQTRMAGVRVRRANNSANSETGQARQMASHGQRLASLEADHAEAAYSQAVADARTASRANGGRVPPAQHDALLRAIDRRDTAVAALESRKATTATARAAHVRSHLEPGEEPAYVSQQPIPIRSPAIPTGRVTAKVKVKRTGEGIKAGTLDAHPAKLVEQAMGTQRLIDAANARTSFIHDWGYRGIGHEHGDLREFDTASLARKHAMEQDLQHVSGFKWEPVKQQNGKYALLPKEAMDEVRAFEKGTNVNPALKSYTSRWRRVVLAFSPRWLVGNSFEAAVRSIVAGAGPASYITAKRTLKAMDAEGRAELEARALGGGQYSVSQRLAQERVTVDELGRLGRAGHAFWSHPVPHTLAGLYGLYTHFVFQTLNGRIEHAFQTAQLGRALRNHPLMDNHIVGLSQKAAQEAAEGLKDTATMVELGRAVDRMYGRYGKFSPGLQNAIANYTPFIAWTLNSVRFLTDVMPRDHPVLTGLIAASNQATEAWRKQHGLFLDALGKTDKQLPGWLQGSIPGSNGSHLRLSRYTPAGLFDNDTGPLGGIASTLLPQFQEIVQNLGGKDWTGKDLSKNPNVARAALASIVSFIEGQVPIAAQGAAVAGLHMPNDRDQANRSSGGGTRAREQFDPFRFTPAKKPTSSTKDPLAAKYGLGSGSSVDDLAKKYGLGSGSSVDDLAKKYGLK